MGEARRLVDDVFGGQGNIVRGAGECGDCPNQGLKPGLRMMLFSYTVTFWDLQFIKLAFM